jgi:putative ABC transport system permease protein
MLADFLENVRVAFDGLLANKLRSGLTMLGVIIGVGAVIALMSIGEGAQASITDEINAIGSNLIFVLPEDGSLTIADAQALADPDHVPGALAVAPEFGLSTQVIFGGEDVDVPVTGVTADYQRVYGQAEVSNGRFIEEGDVDGRDAVAVLGHRTAIDLFGGFDPLGQKVKVATADGGRVSLTVVGVLAEQESSGMNDPNEEVLVPISTAQTRIFDGRNSLGEPVVHVVNVAAISEEQVDDVIDDVTAVMRRRHDIDADEDDDFRVLNQADILDVANEVTGILTTFLGAIAGISLLVGGIGIMNIMLVSVTERTREIGLRKALGATPRTILQQFLIEAVVLTVIGGAIGVTASVGVLWAIVQLVPFLDVFVVNPWVVAMAFLVSVATGVIFGVWPARRAAALSPIEALRYE